MFAPKCGGCCLPIMDNFISAIGKQWHPDCFICQVSFRLAAVIYKIIITSKDNVELYFSIFVVNIIPLN